MDYFGGLQFIRAQDSPVNKRMFDRFFDDYYGLQYNHHGPFVFSCGDAPLCEYNGPHAFITCPGPKFRYGTTPDKPRHHCYVCFKGPRVKKFIRFGLLPVGPNQAPIKITDPEEFHLGFMELLSELSQNQPSVARCVNILESLLLQIYNSSQSMELEKDKLNMQIGQLGLDISRNPRRRWNFKEAALHMKISYPHFRRRFAEIHDSPPGQFLLNAKLDHAAKMLTESVMPISIIAEKIGMEDVCHFNKLFKRKFLLPPGKYRKDFFE